MIRRIPILCLTTLVLLSASASTAANAASPEPVAAWQILQGSDPTILPLGGSAALSGNEADIKFHGVITNLGGAEAEPATITDTVSAGASPSPTEAATVWFEGPAEELKKVPCVTAGQSVTCEVSAKVKPGGNIQLYVPIDVSAGAPPSVSNEIVIASAGSSTATNVLSSKTGNESGAFSFVPGAYGESISVSDEAGGVPAAGSHPFMVATTVHVPTAAVGLNAVDRAVDPLRGLNVALPSGLVADPMATGSRCTLAELNGGIEVPATGCSPEAQVGVAQFEILNSFATTEPLFNMVPPHGVPAEFAFALEKAVVHIQGSLDSGFHLTAGSRELLAKFPISGVTVDLWGDPSDPRHDYQRKGVGYANSGCGGFELGCSVSPARAPFLTMPTSCTEAVRLAGFATGWLGGETRGEVPMTDVEGNPFDINGCNALEFNPTISSKATTNVADSPSGLDFNLHQPQNQQLDGLATAALKDSTVTLPAGMNLNPAVADGLAACTEAQMGYAPEEGKIRFATTHQSCPDASKLGTVEIKTPLLKEKLPGAIYLAKPYENPFGNLTSIYLAIEDEETGIIAKLAGKATPDPVSGQLTASFTENPQLPVEDIDLHFFNGARGAFTTPLTCGTKTTTSTLTPWSTPEGQDATPTDSFQTQVAAGGNGACPTSEANAPNAPAFTAGTVAPEAGAYSPFVLRLARQDGTQRLTAIDTTLPKGLAAKFAGIPYCSEAQIAQAQSRSNPNQGALEKASPSCPAASEVGIVDVGAGSGPTPLYVQGHAYLAGPYKGAPLSLAIITPAVAGPFDLGAVVVRTALYINPETAQGRAVSDPLPSILQGIPLDIRSIAVKLGRPDFTLNPTSCDPMAITGAATALTGQSTALTSPFQVGGCNALKFKPDLKISLKGGTKRHRFPALKAVLTYPQGGNYANIASAQVTLPHSAFLEQSHIGTVCTRVQFAADACPKASIYGKARAITPLLDQPLEGPVYLRSSSHELPDLVAALNGQIDVVLAGRVDTGKGGGIRNTFEAVPDAPVSKFVLEMKGGRKGLLVNSENICRKTQKASVSFTAQNGDALSLTPTIKNSCGGKAKKKHAKKGSHSKKGGKGK